MITQATIDAVFSSANIVDIIAAEPGIKLKRTGANHQGLCPFHNEKTPSFNVSAAKGIYKCFGCGKGGNVVDFVMNKHGKNFPEAIEYLAEKYNIAIEYDQANTRQVSQELKDKRTQARDLLQWAADQYEKSFQALPADHPAKLYMESRGYTEDRVKYWGIGYAPADFKFLTSPIIASNRFSIASEIGLIKTKNSSNYDFYYNRIIVPIFDYNGAITGFAARQIPTDNKEEDKKWPKWINPANSLAYNKSQTWYGLNTARSSIQEERFAYIVEGYPDVHAMQDNGMPNTIAPCGKEITADQIKFLRRYTDTVCFVPNIDDNQSGQNAVMKWIDPFLQHGFKTNIVILPECNDADEYIRKHSANTEIKAA